MEIIKTGLEISEAECPECGTTLRYWPAEVKTEVLPGYVGFYSTRAPRLLYNYIVCPLCGRRIIISRYEYETTESEDKQDFWRKIKGYFTKGGNHASDKILKEREEKD